MRYIAHKDGEREQSVKEHLYGTAKLSGEFAAKFGKEDWGYCCGLLHDIGKYSMEFQNKIQENTNAHVDHSSAGAQLCMEQAGYYTILSYCIAGHHSGLPNYGNKAIASSLCGRIGKKIFDYQAYKNEIQIPQLYTNPIEFCKERNMDFSLSMFIRMLYSCLVDADFLDTEIFMKNGDTGRNSGEAMDVLMKRLEEYISEWLRNDDIYTLNGRRTQILKHCLQNGQCKRGIFRLTVPTGGGKTIASLAFALRHATEHNMDRIIYVVPYTNIIEQNAQVFRQILGGENVLENHYNVEFKTTEDSSPIRLAAENWDKPVVVTTNVQFFESLFGNKSSRCRKLHNIANSVVIFDEAQMIPLDYLIPCSAALQELVRCYGASIVLCTATQPALDNFFESETSFIELCPDVKDQFQFFKRVIYQQLGKITKEWLAEQLGKEKHALCIVNTKMVAQELYHELRGDGVYHLSTCMYPKHRVRVLKDIRKRMEEIQKNPELNKRCIVISTSLIEAGVDLDFVHVYRQIAGMDSIIQAAGRCNREGKRKIEESQVYVFELENTKSVLSQKLQIDTARMVLQDYEDIAELECVEDYFLQLYHSRGTTLDSKNIMGEFQNRQYNFETVAEKFKLIEQDTKTIFINAETEANELLQELKWKGASKERMRALGQYCIQLYDNKREDSLFNKLNGAGMIRPISEEIQDLYELISLKQYSEEFGLDCSINNGMALFG